MENNKRVTRITEEERALIKHHFKGNDKLLVIVRKMFLAEYDPDAQIGAVVDQWMNVECDNVMPEEVVANVKAVKKTIATIEGGLRTLQAIANLEEQSEEEIAKKKAVNSSK